MKLKFLKNKMKYISLLIIFILGIFLYRMVFDFYSILVESYGLLNVFVFMIIAIVILYYTGFLTSSTIKKRLK